MNLHTPTSALWSTACTCGLALAAAGLSILLAACGGAQAEPGAAPPSAPASAASFDNAPLLADDGSMLPPQAAAVPTDRGAHTREGHYATRRQAATLQDAYGANLLMVDVGCCGREGIDLAISIAHGMQSQRDLPDSAPVLVRSADLRLGAMAADRLTTMGHSRVWLVTP